MLTFPFTLLQRSLDCEILGDLDEAIAILREGIDTLNPAEHSQELPVLTHHLAILCDKAGRTTLGIEYVKKCLTTSPDDLGLLYTLTRRLIMVGQTAEARVAVEKFRTACELSTDKLRSGWAELQGILERDLAGLTGEPEAYRVLVKSSQPKSI